MRTLCYVRRTCDGLLVVYTIDVYGAVRNIYLFDDFFTFFCTRLQFTLLILYLILIIDIV